jgi:hypothetical protein
MELEHGITVHEPSHEEYSGDEDATAELRRPLGFVKLRHSRAEARTRRDGQPRGSAVDALFLLH